MQPRRTPHEPALLALTAVLLVAVAPGFAAGEAPAAHRQARCGDCHGGGTFAAADMPQTGLAAAAIARRCTGCHDQRRPVSDGGRAFHDRADQAGPACIACHTFHEPGQLRAGDREFTVTLGDSGRQAHCAACHQPGVDLGRIDSAHRFAAAAVYHDDSRDLAGLSPSEGCLVCHGTSGAGLEMPGDGPRAIAINTHASHPLGIGVTPGQGRGDGRIRRDVDPRLPLPDGRIECVTCHAIPAGTKNLLVPFDDPYALCLGCHLVGDAPRRDGSLALVDGR